MAWLTASISAGVSAIPSGWIATTGSGPAASGTGAVSWARRTAGQATANGRPSRLRRGSSIERSMTAAATEGEGDAATRAARPAVTRRLRGDGDDPYCGADMIAQLLAQMTLVASSAIDVVASWLRATMKFGSSIAGLTSGAFSTAPSLPLDAKYTLVVPMTNAVMLLMAVTAPSVVL